MVSLIHINRTLISINNKVENWRSSVVKHLNTNTMVDTTAEYVNRQVYYHLATTLALIGR